MSASIKDVAELAGVSTATVSRVLSNKPHISLEARERVLSAVQQLDYSPNLVARSLRVQQANIIGLLVSDIRNPFFTEVSRSVEDAAYAEGMNVFLCNTEEDVEKEGTYLRLMRNANVAGVILSPTLRTAENLAGQLDPQWPMVVIDRRVESASIDMVLLDNVDSAYRLTEHLLGDGHSRIASVMGVTSATGRERREGYLRALRSHGIEPEPELSKYVDPRDEAGYKAACELLARPDRPDAIVTSNSLLTQGALRAIQDSGLALPDEIALAGFDDTTWTSLVRPGITVIAQPTYEVGQTAVELLMRRLEDPTRSAREVVLRGKLVVRGSCAHHGA